MPKNQSDPRFEKFNEIVDAVGSPYKLASLLETPVAPPSVYSWYNKGIPAARVLNLVQIAADHGVYVSPSDLRPDINWDNCD